MTLFSRTLPILMAIATFTFTGSAPTIQSATTQESVDKCLVCHNGKNPHTVEIPCKQVPKYLANHPGDYEGQCQNVTGEKPPKPHPNPKP